MLLRELAPGFETIHLGHYEIHYREIGGVFSPLLESAATVFGFTDHYPIVLLFEHTPQLGADHGVIIDEKNSDHGTPSSKWALTEGADRR